MRRQHLLIFKQGHFGVSVNVYSKEFLFWFDFCKPLLLKMCYLFKAEIPKVPLQLNESLSLLQVGTKMHLALWGVWSAVSTGEGGDRGGRWPVSLRMSVLEEKV